MGMDHAAYDRGLDSSFLQRFRWTHQEICEQGIVTRGSGVIISRLQQIDRFIPR